ncbi:MAG: Rqc2 family fibronectin-binding protein, partial [Bacillota bacterium]
MAIDGILLNNCKYDLENKIINSRINKIYQMGKKKLTINIRQPGESLKLLISIDPEGSRVHLTNLKFEHPSHPPDFCMILRKYLINGNIIAINQPEFERILHLKIDKGGKIFTLILEIMGRYSNVILVDEGNTVLDAMKRIGEKKNKERQLYPGITYKAPPPQDKLNPLKIEKEDFFNKIPNDFKKYCFKAIMYNFRGIGPNMAREIVYRAGLDYERHYNDLNESEVNEIWNSFDDIFSKVKNGKFNPTVGFNEDNLIKYTSAFELKHLEEIESKSFSSTSKLFDYFYENHIQKRKFIKLKKRLVDIVKNFLEKNRKKQRELRGKIKESKNADKYKRKGELIKSNIYQINKGDKYVKVVNYFDPEQKEIKINLDPEKSPAENAQKFFKKYEKAKKSYDHLKRQLGKFRHEERYLEQVQ